MLSYLFGPPSLISSQHHLRSLLRHFAPPAMVKLRSELTFIHCVNKIGFRLFYCGPIGALWHWNPHPLLARSSMFAKANIETSLGAGIPCPIAWTISKTNAWYKSKVRFQQSNKYTLVTFLHLGASLWVPL